MRRALALVGLIGCRAPSSPDADGETTQGDGTHGEESGQEASCALSRPVEVGVFERQPMVADLRIELSDPGQVMLAHDDDPGVRIGVDADPDETAVSVRVRGLAPGIPHRFTATVSADGCEDRHAISFEAPPALPGFLAGLPVASPAPPDPSLRLLDLNEVPQAGISRLLVLDAAGTTRFYLGEPAAGVGPATVRAGLSLRGDGTLLYVHGDAIRIVDELGDPQLTITAQQLGVPSLHHDVVERAGGTFLVLTHTFRDVDYPGEGTLHVAGDKLLEVERDGDVVWEWDTFDHLDPLRIRDGFELPVPDPDAGTVARDWTHANGMVERDGVILLSLRHQDWLIAIDRADGELRWRLGDGGDFALAGGSWFFHQHSPQWQDDGRLLLYDNGVGNPDLPDAEERGMATLFSVDEQAMEARREQDWDQDAVPSPVAGDADRMPTGNLLVLDSSAGGPTDWYARLRELDAAGGVVWETQTESGTFAYRAVPIDRLPGE